MQAEPAAFAGVLVLHKTIDVLEALRESPSGSSLAELAAKLRMPKATVFRIVATLESRGYLERNSGGRYRVGGKLFQGNTECTSQQAIIRAARPEMDRLLARCKETLNLGVLDGGEVLVIETIESPQSVRMSSKIGNRRHPHSTALGKVLLADLPEKDVLRILKTRGMPKFTAHTITKAMDLVVELETVRQRGYALDDRENEEEGRCIAAPVFGPRKTVLAALSVSGPIPRMTVARARGFLGELMTTTSRISSSIGGQP